MFYLIKDKINLIKDKFNLIKDKIVSKKDKPTIIVLSSYSRCGKDYVAKIIEGKLKLKDIFYRKFAFADKLKEYISNILRINIFSLNDMKNKNITIDLLDSRISFRDLIKSFADESKKMFGENIWAKLVIKEIKQSNERVFIITDLRFLIEQQELESLKNNYNIHYVFIESSIKTCKKLAGDNEVPLLKQDYVLKNCEDINELTTNIDSLLKELNI